MFHIFAPKNDDPLPKMEREQALREVRQLLKKRKIYFQPFWYKDGTYEFIGSGEFDGVVTHAAKLETDKLSFPTSAKPRFYDWPETVTVEWHPNPAATMFSPPGTYLRLYRYQAEALGQLIGEKRGFCPHPTLSFIWWLFWKDCAAKWDFEENLRQNLERSRMREKNRSKEAALWRLEKDSMRYFDGEWFHEDHF